MPFRRDRFEWGVFHNGKQAAWPGNGEILLPEDDETGPCMTSIYLTSTEHPAMGYQIYVTPEAATLPDWWAAGMALADVSGALIGARRPTMVYAAESEHYVTTSFTCLAGPDNWASGLWVVTARWLAHA